MQAVIYEKYGDPTVLQLAEVAKPVARDNEILVKIHASSVTSGDVRLRASDFPAIFWLPARIIFGLFSPKKKILGHEFAGVVEAMGSNIRNFSIGDQVFGTTTMLKSGAYAEYIAVPEKWKSGVVEIKPNNLSFEEAAALPIGAMTAMDLLSKTNVQPGDEVLVYGASGSVGSYAIQLAVQAGARVTGVCSSANFEMVKSLGADTLIDYHSDDYSQLDKQYQVVFDAVGKTSRSTAKKVLHTGGKFVTVKSPTKEKPSYLNRIKSLAESSQIRAFIDATYSMNEIVNAHQHVDSGRKRGNVVIRIVT